MLSYDFPGSFWNGKYAENNSRQEGTKSRMLPVTDKDLASTMCCAARHLLVLDFGQRENTSGAK